MGLDDDVEMYVNVILRRDVIRWGGGEASSGIDWLFKDYNKMSSNVCVQY